MPSITRKTSSKREARRQTMVTQMLAVVEDLLSEGETFTAISVERLIKQAGISRSTFYVYFEDKGALLLALAQDVVERLLGAAQSWWDLPPGAVEEDVQRALRSIIDVYRDHTLIWDSLVDASSYDPKVRAAFREIVGQSATELAKHIRDGQKQGYVRDEVDPKRTALWLTWMTERGLYTLTPDAGPAELDRLCKAQTDIVWQTLYAGSRSRS